MFTSFPAYDFGYSSTTTLLQQGAGRAQLPIASPLPSPLPAASYGSFGGHGFQVDSSQTAAFARCGTHLILPSYHLMPELPGAKVPASVTPPPSAAPVTQKLSAARGKAGVLKRLSTPAVGVSQEPVGCMLQLEECVAACRREVELLAAECRLKGAKFLDSAFPPDERSLSQSSHTGTKPGPFTWARASELPAFAGRATAEARAPEILKPGALGPLLLGAAAVMRAIGQKPRELLVCYDQEAGVCGVRFFKDGEWMYEVVDDHLPIDVNGQVAGSLSSVNGQLQVWPALVEKAYAKVHGSYESLRQSDELDVLEDLLGAGTRRLRLEELPIWGELWQHLRSQRRRGFALMAVRKREMAGELLTSGLVSGFGYPVTRLEMVDGEMLCELQNPWHIGSWKGRWSPTSPEILARPGQAQLQPKSLSDGSFWMNIQDFAANFTEVFQNFLATARWQSSQVVSSSSRPSYALLSVPSRSRAVLTLTQADRRWGSGTEAELATLGLRVYRSRILVPPQSTVGGRQNVSNPFRNLELVAECAPCKAHSLIVEVPKLDPKSIYVAAICRETEEKLPFALLQVLTSSMPRLRVLSVPESLYFLKAQSEALDAVDSDSFSSLESLEGRKPFGGEMDDDDDEEVDEAEDYPWDAWAAKVADTTKVNHFLQLCLRACGAGW